MSKQIPAGKFLRDLAERFLVNFLLVKFSKLLRERLETLEEIRDGNGGAPHAPREGLVEGEAAKPRVILDLGRRARARRHDKRFLTWTWVEEGVVFQKRQFGVV
jgi:hypothetical protein